MLNSWTPFRLIFVLDGANTDLYEWSKRQEVRDDRPGGIKPSYQGNLCKTDILKEEMVECYR